VSVQIPPNEGVQALDELPPPTVRATVLARTALIGELSVSEVVDQIAQHFADEDRVDSFIAALTQFDPRDPGHWVSLGGRAWLREWRSPDSPVLVVPPDLSGPEDALSMPWMSQFIRNQAVVIQDSELLPEEAAQDKREMAKCGGRALISAAQFGDGMMFGSFSIGSATPGPWPEQFIADFLLLNDTLTARMQTEHAKRASAEAMDLAEQARGHQQQFFATIGHELRTPIAAIIGFAEVLADEAELRIEKEGDFPTQAQHDAGVILRAADQLHAIVEDLLSTGRTLGDEEARGKQDLGLAVDDVIHWHHTPALARRMTVTSTIPADTYVLGRASGLRQVLTNLIGNAIVHNVEGGTVDVSVERSMDEARDHRVRVIVRDHGRGLAPDEVARVFEPFVRFAQEGVKGTGLGLSLARAVAERDGAVIGVRSSLGEGSTFWVDYPAG
jgi:signal transduction histidine kinase